MGIFSRIKNAFGQKPKQIKTLKLSEALPFFNNELKEKESQSLNEIGSLKQQIPEIMEELKAKFEKLGEAKVPEERAAGSQLAKDSFVNKSMKLLSNIEDYDDAEKMSSLLNSIVNITPRQVLHLDFFFREQMMAVGSVLKRLKQTMDRINELQNSGIAKERRMLEKLLKEAADAEERIMENGKKIEELEKNKDMWSAEIKDKSERLALMDVSEMDIIKKDMTEMKKELDSINQHIDTSFGASERFLKKYLHDIESSGDTNKLIAESNEESNEESQSIGSLAADEMSMLRKYVETLPHIAFNQDENLIVKSLLQKSLEHARGDADVFDAKRAEKVEILINDLGSLAKELKRAKELESSIQKKENEIENIWIPKQKHRKYIEKEIDDLVVNIDAIDREILDLNQDTQLKQKKIPLAKDEISRLLTAAVGREVEVE